MRLDIGIASWNNYQALDRTLQALRDTCRSDWRVLVFDNASEEEGVRQVIARHAVEEPRIVPFWSMKNLGYAGAVNAIIARAETDCVAYFDNDCQPVTIGWDMAMVQTLYAYHELGMLFPRPYVHYPIRRPNYDEVLWGVGCAWVVNRMAARDAWSVQENFFDERLGHHEEVDFQTRVRLQGWKIAAYRDVHVRHEEHASHSAESIDRINAGVKRWVDKWEGYFGGKAQDYHSPNVMRFTLWPPHALYLEEYFLHHLPEDFNGEPEVVRINGEEFDLIKVVRPKGFYRGRSI